MTRATPRRRAPRLARSLAALTLLAGTAAACGGDDDIPTEGAAAPRGEAAAGDAAATDVDGDCHGTDLDFTNLETGVSGTATTALATSDPGGGLPVVHAADFDLAEEDLASWRPEVPDGGNVISIQLTVFSATEDPAPLAPGTTLEWTSEPGQVTFVVRHFTTDEDWSETLVVGDDDDRTRAMTVTGVGDALCFEIDFADDQKQISGTVEAPMVEGS